MRHKGLLFATFILLIVFSFMVLHSSPAAAKKVYRWKIQSAFPRGDLSMEQLKIFARAAKKRSGGRLIVSVFAEPEIVAGDVLPESVKKGTLQMCHIAAAPYSGTIPVGSVEMGLPYQWIIPEEKTLEGKAHAIRKFVFESGFVDILRREYAKQNLYWLDMHVYGPVPFMLSRRPVESCEDMKGLKIRDAGIWTRWHNALGARGTSMRGSETYMGLKLGTVDAANWDVSAVTGLKWHEVAPYWLRGAENEHAIGNISVNLDAWNALPDDLKQALSGAAKDYYDYNVKGYAEEIEIVENMVKEGKLKVSYLDEACLQRHREEALKLWDEQAKKDPSSAEAIQLVKEWRGIK
jgi:TRAP-type C4-dicarboxylate transport system substrate-binding protein